MDVMFHENGDHVKLKTCRSLSRNDQNCDCHVGDHLWLYCFLVQSIFVVITTLFESLNC